MPRRYAVPAGRGGSRGPLFEEPPHGGRLLDDAAPLAAQHHDAAHVAVGVHRGSTGVAALDVGGHHRRLAARSGEDAGALQPAAPHGGLALGAVRFVPGAAAPIADGHHRGAEAHGVLQRQGRRAGRADADETQVGVRGGAFHHPGPSSRLEEPGARVGLAHADAEHPGPDGLGAGVDGPCVGVRVAHRHPLGGLPALVADACQRPRVGVDEVGGGHQPAVGRNRGRGAAFGDGASVAEADALAVGRADGGMRSVTSTRYTLGSASSVARASGSPRVRRCGAGLAATSSAATATISAER